MLGLEHGLEEVLEAERDVGVFCGVGAYEFDGYFAHVFLWSSTLFLADEFVDVYGAVVEVGFGEEVHAVAHVGLQEVVGYHGVEHGRCEVQSVVGEHGEVVLEVLPHLEDGGALVEGSEFFEDGLCLCALGRDGDVVGLAFLYGEAESDEFGVDGLCGGCLGVDADFFGVEQPLQELGAQVGGVGQLVVGGGVVFFCGGRWGWRWLCGSG